MKSDEVKTLLEKYYEGQTSLAEEEQLHNYFRQNEVPDTLQEEAVFFGLLNSAKTTPEPTNDHDLWAKVLAQHEGKKQKVFSLSKLSGMAATIALLIIGFGSGLLYERSGFSGNDVQMTALQEDVQDLKEMLLFDRISHTSASERIRAVQSCQTLPDRNAKVLELLINTMNTDPNVNVRLAAMETLYHFADDSSVREALVRSLRIQHDPGLQVTLINILVTLDEKQALDEMQRMIQEESIPEVVKQQAELGIGKLL